MNRDETLKLCSKVICDHHEAAIRGLGHPNGDREYKLAIECKQLLTQGVDGYTQIGDAWIRKDGAVYEIAVVKTCEESLGLLHVPVYVKLQSEGKG